MESQTPRINKEPDAAIAEAAGITACARFPTAAATPCLADDQNDGQRGNGSDCLLLANSNHRCVPAHPVGLSSEWRLHRGPGIFHLSCHPIVPGAR